MKSVVADYRYRVACMRIVPTVGSSIYLTDYVHDLSMGGHTYLSTPGYQFTGYSATSDFSPSSIDVEGSVGVGGMDRETLLFGTLDGARCYSFWTTWVNPIEDEEPISLGFFGKVTLMDDRFRVNYTSLVDALNQEVNNTYRSQCSRVFGSAECGIPLAANTVTGTLTGVTSGSLFQDSARAESAGVFTEGTIQFTTGANAGLRPAGIKTHVAGGVLETYDVFPHVPVIGDAYTLVRGCQKTLVACQNRIDGGGAVNNVVNFNGDLWIPLGSTYAHVGRSS